MDLDNRLKLGERGALISIAAYLALALLKTIAGVVTHSEALLADGLNNGTDTLASVAVLIGLRISRKPPDADHPYGHYRAETVAALVASFLMFIVGAEVLHRTALSFAEPRQTPDAAAAWVGVFSALAMYALYRYNLRTARRIRSQALLAAALDNRSDALVSVGAVVGIAASRMGWPWLDPLAGFAVGLIIIKTSWDVFRDATHSLTDGFDEQKLAAFRQTIRTVPGVVDVREIKARYHGSAVHVDVVICVDHRLNVTESHDIAENVEQLLQKQHQVNRVHVHIEPVE